MTPIQENQTTFIIATSRTSSHDLSTIFSSQIPHNLAKKQVYHKTSFLSQNRELRSTSLIIALNLYLEPNITQTNSSICTTDNLDSNFLLAKDYPSS